MSVESDKELDSQREELNLLRKAAESLRNIKNIQCSDGRWDYSPYMHGMANGLILALSIFDDDCPKYLEPPERWLKNLPEYDDEPVTHDDIEIDQETIKAVLEKHADEIARNIEENNILLKRMELK